MKKLLLSLIVLFLFFSCKQKVKQAKEQKSYVISYEDEKQKKEMDSINNSGGKLIAFPYVPKGVSLECNLILDKNENLYFYSQKIISAGCGTGREKDTLVKFLNIQPKDLTKISIKNAKRTIWLNINESYPRFVLASQKDTIPNKIMKMVYEINTPTYVIRRTTQEEDSVLFYKQNDIYYDSKNIKWDKIKMKF